MKQNLSRISSSLKNRQPRRINHLWAIIVIFLFEAFLYYIGQTQLANTAFFKNSFLTGLHDLHRALFLIPLLYATIIFRVKGSLVASFLFLCVVLPRAFMFSPYPDALLRAMVFVVVAAAISLVAAVYLNHVDRERINAIRESYLNSLNDQEQGKLQLGRELHDGSLQEMIDICHHIDAISDAEENIVLKNKLKNLRGLVDATMTEIRQIITGLRPPALEEMGLESALHWLADELTTASKIEVKVNAAGEKRSLNSDIELNLFRIAQEALQNAKKHAQPTEISVNLSFTRDTVHLTIQDNGVGFSILPKETLAAQRKFGLIGMSERVNLVGGRFRIDSTPGRGTTVSVELPIK